MICKSLLYQP